MADIPKTPEVVQPATQEIKASWDGGFAALLFSTMVVHAAIVVGREFLRARTAIKIAEIQADAEMAIHSVKPTQ